MSTDCQGDLTTKLTVGDGPFEVEIIGCTGCSDIVYAFIHHDNGATSHVEVDRGSTPEEAARQAVARWAEMMRPLRRT